MKIKKSLTALLCLISLICNCSCQELFQEKKYELLQDREQIQEISIVNVLSMNVKEYETIRMLSDKDKFLDDFEKIMFERYILGDPTHISSGLAIRILYENGDCEFINHYAQERIISGEVCFGVVYCDKNEFQVLLDKYSKES